MSLAAWLQGLFRRSADVKVSGTSQAVEEALADVFIRELALGSCINLISRTVSKCEFKTFFGGDEVKNNEYYLWNAEPNRNQNACEFINKLINTLYTENECLIVERENQLFIADAYSPVNDVLAGDRYEQITVGETAFAGVFQQSDVLHYRLNERNAYTVIRGLYDSYAKLITYSVKSYQRSRGNRIALSIDAIKPGDDTAQRALDDLINNKFSRFLAADNAAIAIPKGYEIKDPTAAKTYSNETTRDIRAMIDDVSDFTAKAFDIPPVLLRGNVQGISDAVEQFLTFCIDPLCRMLEQEINRKRYGKRILQGDYIKIDTGNIKHIDILTASTAIDKLIASAVFSVNDVLRLLGRPTIPEPWADKHYMTQNYALMEEVIRALEGGDNSAK